MRLKHLKIGYNYIFVVAIYIFSLRIFAEKSRYIFINLTGL